MILKSYIHGLISGFLMTFNLVKILTCKSYLELIIFQTLIQQARSRVSCVVERRRADEVMDGTGDNGLDNSTDPQRFQRLSGERVAILCESGSPNQE